MKPMELNGKPIKLNGKPMYNLNGKPMVGYLTCTILKEGHLTGGHLPGGTFDKNDV